MGTSAHPYRLIAALVVAVLLGVFIAQNTAILEVRFLFWTVAMSRSLMVLAVFAAGMLVGWFLHGWWQRSRRRPRL